MAENEERLRLIFELVGEQEAARFDRLTITIARRAEEAASRVASAGKKMALEWNEALQRFRDVKTKQIVPTDLGIRELGGWKKTGYDIWQAQQRMADGAEDAAGRILNTNRNLMANAAAMAATFYAVSRAVIKAYQNMEDAASKRAMRIALVSMGNYFSVESERIVESLIEISDETLSTADAVQVANMALIAGARPFAESVPQLFEIARASAVATGKDVMWVFDTLVRGIARAEPRLIDNANIYLSVAKAAGDLAEAEGKVYDELDRKERMYYTLNAVLQEGGEITESVGQAAEDAIQPFQRFRAEVKNLKDGFWAAITAGTWVEKLFNALGDAAEWLANRLIYVGAAISLFAEMETDTLATGETFRRSAIDSLNKWGESYKRRVEEAKRALGELTDAEQSWSESAEGRRITLWWDFDASGLAEQQQLSEEYLDYLEDLYRAEEQSFSARLKANQDFADDMIDLNRDFYDELEEIMQDYQDELDDIARQAADRRADVEGEYHDRLADAQRDYNDRAEDLARDHGIALERIERDYRERILRIEEDFAMGMWDAVARRDATAALRLRRQRALDLRRAERDRDRRITEENEDYAASVEDLEETYADRREEAEEYRRQELEDIREWEARKLRDAQIDHQRELEELRTSYNERAEELARHHRERLDEIATQYEYERELARIQYEFAEDAFEAHLLRMNAIAQREGLEIPYPFAGRMGEEDLGGIFPDWFADVQGPEYGPGEIPPNVDLGDQMEEQVAAQIDALIAGWEQELDLADTHWLDDMPGVEAEGQDDRLDQQEDYQQDSVDELEGFYDDTLRETDSHNRDMWNRESSSQRGELQLQKAWEAYKANDYAWFLNALARELYYYHIDKMQEVNREYAYEQKVAISHYRYMEALYLDHLRRLWMIYDTVGAPPAPAPGVPEIVDEYATEKSQAVSHYRDIEGLYEQHLRNLWGAYKREGIPSAVPGGFADGYAGGRNVTAPSPQSMRVDMSDLNLNQQISATVNSAIAGFDGQVQAAVNKALFEVFRQ